MNSRSVHWSFAAGITCWQGNQTPSEHLFSFNLGFAVVLHLEIKFLNTPYLDLALFFLYFTYSTKQIRIKFVLRREHWNDHEYYKSLGSIQNWKSRTIMDYWSYLLDEKTPRTYGTDDISPSYFSCILMLAVLSDHRLCPYLNSLPRLRRPLS